MSTRMPILKNIIDIGTFEGDELTVKLIKHIAETTFFEVQVAADIQQQKALAAPDQVIVIDESVGQIRSPYPEIWMEWSRGDYHVGCLLVQREKCGDNSYFDATHSDQGLIFWLMEDGAHSFMRTDYTVAVRMTDNDCFGGWAIDGEPLDDELSATTQTWIGIVTMALSLINCKNVTTKETGRIHLRRSGAEKRRGEPVKIIRYHTIMLPGGGTQSDGQGGHRATALHRVRGHFKTFTADKPLMGQHVGTYWWGWQVRGNPENGAVVSDYKLRQKVE